MAILLALLMTTSGARAAEACAPPATELVRWDQAEALAAGLPRIFRYDVTIDDRRQAFLVQPKCVVSYLEDHYSWNKYVVRDDLLSLMFSWTLDLRYPAWIDFDGPKMEFVRVILRHRAGGSWPGQIVRGEDDRSYFDLPFEVPACPRFLRSRSSVVHRRLDGSVVSAEFRRRQLERERRRCEAGTTVEGRRPSRRPK